VRKAVRLAVLERDGYVCRYCGADLPRNREDSEFVKMWGRMTSTRTHVDHIVPRVHGGSDDPSNLVAACRGCNLAKYDQVWEPTP
jgi:5-methylcytosine-specific restriction endonuclease McrA